MSGLLRRLTRRRPATADETGTPAPESSEPAGAPAHTPAEPAGGEPAPAPDEQATQVLPATADQPTVVEQPQQSTVRDLPAGIDPGELADAPAASAGRGKLRRRLRYLRRVRELLLRDLGGFIFELHRTAGGTPQEGHRRLIESKAKRLVALDAEVRGLEARLGEPHEATVMREPGIGGLCPECGELHASDAHYCARCGTPLDAKARATRDAAVAAATKPVQPAPEPAPASVLWAAGPRPRAAAEDDTPAASDATSQWLALPEHAPSPAPPAAEDDEVAATGDEATTRSNETVAPTNDEPAPADDEAAPGEAPKVDEPAEEKTEAEPPKRTRKPPEHEISNGKRGDDVPLPSPDPLGSRREQGS
jgi:hypothetical protein